MKLLKKETRSQRRIFVVLASGKALMATLVVPTCGGIGGYLNGGHGPGLRVKIHIS
jgi:hypothetical protein